MLLPPQDHMIGLCPAAIGPNYGDSSALLSWRSWNVKTCPVPPFMACLHSPFPPSMQGKVVSLCSVAAGPLCPPVGVYGSSEVFSLYTASVIVAAY